ncbi:MAG: exodeoxyribonuclease VII large subunit [Rhodocyclaceae bacterium]
MTDALFQPIPEANVLPVSEIVHRARALLESTLPLCWVSGEISSVTRAASGHVYFTLKDSSAQMRCVMWRTRAQLLPFQLAEGMRVEVRAQITVYEPRGDLQLSVESVRRAGQGNLYEAFMRLKARLTEEGLFDAEHKRPLPTLPRAVGVVTSKSGAALHDVLVTLRRRAPAMRVVVYPTQVQGDGVGELIARTIAQAGARAEHDGIEALIVCRGGGSLEDLWGFNHEAVVRAIHASPIPVVSGVGHETDTTLCDFVADLRAATPTAAAEAVSAGYIQVQSRLPMLARSLSRAARHVMNEAWQRVDLAQRRLLHPRERLARSRVDVDKLALRLAHAQGRVLNERRTLLARFDTRLTSRRPRLDLIAQRLDSLAPRLARGARQPIDRTRAHLDALASHLQHLNPEAVLTRGYAIVRGADGHVLRGVGDARVDEAVDIKLCDGTIDAVVIKTTPADRLSGTDDPN